MKNLRKLLAVIISVALLATAMVPAFAEEVLSEAEICEQLGMLRGTGAGVTDEYLESLPDRMQAATLFLRLLGLEEEAIDAAYEDNFDDCTPDTLNAANRAITAYLKANPDLGFAGIGNNLFNPFAKITAKEYYKVLLTVLGYKQGVDFEWNGENDVIAFAQSIGLGAVADVEEFSVNDIAIATVEALQADLADGSKTLIEKLVADGVVDEDVAVEVGLIAPPAPAELAISSVVADNLKSFVVTFNMAVEESSVKISAKETTANTTLTVSFKVLDDKKTVVGYYTSPASVGQSSKVEYTISAKTADGKEIKDEKVTKTINDVTIPAFVGARALNPKQVELQFTEPVNCDYSVYTLLNDIKVDGKAVIAKATANYVDNTVLLTFTTALAEGTHTVEVANVKDFANFVAPTASFDIAVVKDEAAPKAVSAEIKNKNEIVVTFDEPVEVKGSYRVNDVAIADADVEVVANTNNTQWKISNLNLGIGAIVEVKIEYKGQKDIMGNEVKDWTVITTKTSDDTTLPDAEIAVSAGNKITITFTKSMLPNTGTIKLLDKDGNELRAIAVTTFKADTNNKVLEISGAALGLDDVNPGDYSLKLTGLKDATVRGNQMPDKVFPFKALDTKKPTVSNKYLVTAAQKADGSADPDKDTVTIYFSEPMDIASIESLSNYMIAPSSGDTFVPLTADSNAVSAKAAADGKSVVITYKGARNFGSQVFKVVSVKDAAGNYISGISGSLISDEISKQTDTTLKYAGSGNVKAVDVNTIEVTFNSPIASVDPSLFVLYEGSNAKTGFAAAEVKSSDNTVVKFTTAIAIDPDADIYTLKVNVPTAIKNVYGTGLTKDGTNAYAALENFDSVVDQIRPTLVKVEKGAAPNSIKFTFSEPMNLTNYDNFKQQLLVKKSNGEVIGYVYDEDPSATVTPSDNDKVFTVQFTVDGDVISAIKGSADGEKTIKVSLPIASGIADKSTNGLLPIGDQEVKIVVDTTGPVASVSSANETTLVLAFNEALYNSGTAITDGADVKSLFTFSGTGTYTSAIYNASAKTVTFTYSGVATGATLTVAATVTDQAGNAVSTSTDVATYDATAKTWTLN